MKILHIEDDRATSELIQRMLTHAGHRVIMAADARLGLQLASRERPDLILIDYQLPGIDGMQALSLLRTSPVLASTPVIALTAYPTANFSVTFIEQGGAAVLQKPVTRDELLRAIEQLAEG